MAFQSIREKVRLKRTRVPSQRDKKTPESIIVQEMDPEPTWTGRTVKYLVKAPRVFVDFKDYENVTIENVKKACEVSMKKPKGSCHILHSEKGPICSLDSQISSKSIFYVFFKNKQKVADVQSVSR